MTIKLNNVAIQLDVELGKDKFVNVAEVSGESFEEINEQLQEFGGSLSSFVGAKGFEVRYDVGIIKGNVKDFFFKSGEGNNPFAKDADTEETQPQ